VRIGGLDFDFSATEHYVDTLAVRIAGDGSAIGYSADTGPGWSFTEFGRSIDLALCEATLGPADEGAVQHCSARQAASMAADSGVRHLVLTHLLAGTADARQREAAADYNGPVTIATIHERYDV